MNKVVLFIFERFVDSFLQLLRLRPEKMGVSLIIVNCDYTVGTNFIESVIIFFSGSHFARSLHLSQDYNDNYFLGKKTAWISFYLRPMNIVCALYGTCIRTYT